MVNAMPKTKPKRPRHNAHGRRLSVSLPLDQYEALETIAAERRVSLAWVVRDAVYNYLATTAPVSPPERTR